MGLFLDVLLLGSSSVFCLNCLGVLDWKKEQPDDVQSTEIFSRDLVARCQEYQMRGPAAGSHARSKADVLPSLLAVFSKSFVIQLLV